MFILALVAVDVMPALIVPVPLIYKTFSMINAQATGTYRGVKFVRGEFCQFVGISLFSDQIDRDLVET